MLIYWLKVIGPTTGTVLYVSWMFSAELVAELAAEWTANGLTVETWANYLRTVGPDDLGA
jgi:hypothetical protein